MTTQAHALFQPALEALEFAENDVRSGSLAEKILRIAIVKLRAEIAKPDVVEPVGKYGGAEMQALILQNLAKPAQPAAMGVLGLVEMVDAAMVEMKNIHPPLLRSECQRLILAGAASFFQIAKPAQPAKSESESLTEQRLMNLARAARAALPQLCDTSSRGQAERVTLEKAIRYAGLDPYGEANPQSVRSKETQ